MKHILSIAGSDSCAGAGIQADIKTISALGAYALTVITAVTAQNTGRLTDIQEIETDIIYKQLETVFSDIRLDAIKIGMLAGSRVIEVVSQFLGSVYRGEIFDRKQNCAGLPLVIDPVMVSTSGHRLLERDAVESLKKNLFPLATVITPNIPEAEALLGMDIKNISDMEQACRELGKWGSKWVVVKGGHMEGLPVDVAGNREAIHLIEGRRIGSSDTHGTGCTFSSALAVFLACGCDVATGVKKAKAYVERSLENGFAIGEGAAVLDHFADLPENRRR